ncbi:MAG: PQQ-dependent dehydrogenase, methanol/ethanol family, partial [Gammaproteobacteria bacterium]|nr:PQQ-dependent dehydrogenase, methanol/ethanol family [Gammaproteobacteria bacterium]
MHNSLAPKPSTMLKNTFLFLMIACLAACGSEEQAEPGGAKSSAVKTGTVEHMRAVSALTDAQIAAANQDQGNWLSHGRNYQEDRYSELDQINADNIDQLGLAWALDLGTKRGIQATPIVVDGIMYFSGPWSVVWAVDARKGEVIWKYDPQVPRDIAARLCCDVVNRGVALYQGAVFFGTLDGR